MLGLGCYLTNAIADSTNWQVENPDWRITSEAYSDPPYGLIPTNVPFRLSPLKDGRWLWTTNMSATWFGTLDLEIDYKRQTQIQQQWKEQQRRMMDANDPPGIANVREYSRRRWDQKHVWETNAVEHWSGWSSWGGRSIAWSEDTNTGWRVQLRMPTTNAQEALVWVQVGSIVTNSGPGLLTAPDGKYARLELTDPNGKAVPTKKGAAQILYWAESLGRPSLKINITDIERLTNIRRNHHKWYLNSHPPSEDDSSVTSSYPDRISDLEYMRHRHEYYPLPTGSFIWFAGFVSNGPPCMVGWFRLHKLFAIKEEGDYTLTVQPVLYRMHYEGGTFQGYLDRVDLPSVTTKFHLAPSAK